MGKTEDANNKSIVQQYIYKGINGNEDYNRFDKDIKEAVDYWNGVFAKQEYPPKELLDYNLVKAMIYKESRMGYYESEYYPAYPDIMQVGNEGDPALRTLNGKLEEWELIDGEEKQLNYYGKANANTPQDSIYWGIRWLYHKAQAITRNKERYWLSWKDAVDGYGPGNDEYVNYIWRIYKNGIDPDGNILWKKNKNGFSLMRILVTTGIILTVGLIGWYIQVKMGDVSCAQKKYSEYIIDKKQQTDSFSLKDKYRVINEVFLKDLENYKQDGNNNYFAETLKECRKFNCISQSIFYENYKLLVENMSDNRHFLNAVSSLGITDMFYTRDIDNDGENEIIFSVYDPLNRDFASLAIIDRIGDKFSAIEKKIDHGHRSYISIIDLTNDSKPEIAFFVAFGKGGDSLFVYQY
ncbi:MAG: hypothetical protein Q8O41_05575, partial [Candidatus Methanoperedens sp.]|nr:hypothetical protein [Candidatus Methanoperedens sp.]